MTGITYFKNKVREYCKLYDIPTPNMKQNMLLSCITLLEFPNLHYNKPLLEEMSNPYILVTVLHELAHIKLKHYKGTRQQISQYEKEAEFWALDVMRKHEPKMFEELQKEMEK